MLDFCELEFDTWDKETGVVASKMIVTHKNWFAIVPSGYTGPTLGCTPGDGQERRGQKLWIFILWLHE
jgi:hypothetical protein